MLSKIFLPFPDNRALLSCRCKRHFEKKLNAVNIGINNSGGSLCAALRAEFKVHKPPLPCPVLSALLQHGLVPFQGGVKSPSMLGRKLGLMHSSSSLQKQALRQQGPASLLSKGTLAGADCSPTDTLTWYCRDSPTSNAAKKHTDLPKSQCLWQMSSPQPSNKQTPNLTSSSPHQRQGKGTRCWDEAETPAACPAMAVETAHGRFSSQWLQGGSPITRSSSRASRKPIQA